MIPLTDVSLSGLAAAAKRVEVAANNIANQHSTSSHVNGQPSTKPAVARRVDQVSLSNGGVKALVKEKEPGTVAVADLNNPGGTLEMPNVDTASEMIGMKIASYDFKANLRAIQTQDKMNQSLLNILS